jgi:exodeoxyribonuclease VIII
MSDTLTEAAEEFATIAPSEPCPEPGIYSGIAAERYHRWDACSNSRCSALVRSPAFCRYQIDHPSPSTPSMELGTALHVAILEPERFATTYGRGPEGDGRTKAVRDGMAAIARDGLLPLRPGDYDACQMARASAWANRAVREVLERAVDRELSAVWYHIFDETDQEMMESLLCKLRIDAACEGGFILDLKRTKSAQPHAFQGSIGTYGYHRQAAMYLDGMEALGRPQKHYLILAVESTAPYEAALYRIDDEALQAGRTELNDLMTRYFVCQQTGIWSAYPETIQTIGLPRWAYERAYGGESL